jgi:hypothetical protein
MGRAANVFTAFRVMAVPAMTFHGQDARGTPCAMATRAMIA